MDATQVGSRPRHEQYVTTRASWLRVLGVDATAGRGATPKAGAESLAGSRRAEDLWDGHGRAIYALACALLGDEPAAIRAVALGMVDFARQDVTIPPGDVRRALARRVYCRSNELAADSSAPQQLPPAMERVAQIARLQRTCLALCIFGGHSQQQVADLLGVPPLVVARMLNSGLHELRRLRAPETVGSR